MSEASAEQNAKLSPPRANDYPQRGAGRGGTRLGREPYRPPANEHRPILRIGISALCGRDAPNTPTSTTLSAAR